ncbi:MAG: hypothetical protein V7L29_26020 [Nostoc sp.]
MRTSLKVIKRRLTPDEQKRLEELRDRCEWGKLTDRNLPASQNQEDGGR